MTALISVTNITKTYQSKHAVDHLSFDIQKGEICGLVGENGAGKTTLLRMLAGLIRPTSGKMVMDKTIRLGALIESPALQPNLSALANLRYLSLQLNLNYSDKELLNILEIVGLSDVDAKKKSKDFSLGMRQRLAIAIAILDKPDFLILDEPINGLDPVGIKEMRQIILNLRDSYKMTILISSHILSELELVVDRYIIMHQGKILKKLSKNSLTQELQGKLYLQTTDNTAAEKILQAQSIPYQVENDYLALTINTKPMDMIHLMLSQSIDIEAIFKQQQSFENYYLNLIKQGE
ncbi:ATP-binding cassette domain-containing protein [Streptococcus thermophilus]|uniref:ATP-binding cassette domain-containing protein n=1 Tax=Streptococcus TaxID=1301 RepID=UPI0019D2AC0E|nr:ATP-binding cassette domain-containing protein [Streptococcus thermophilus]NCB80410.1 ATP-binding cassette domain-containing protein [Bacilli bacterium]MBN6047424.1 ATP-binding cassette domain-containing protein [Streptococcus thermophilus]MCE2059104.1 ATP-binding cassette domain-containing protein [Streptococcus thermophilus]MCE2061157.1 ATP-binding cassette domain-containing protein [Streptococcus thermophilus]MCE2064434.1 ATP-binding cassette domain-containing protein [Streptococcus ther